MTSESPIDTFTYEQAFAELEQVVAALESNQRPLDETMALFERGQLLARRCAALLETAELKVRLISGDVIEEPDSQV
jgi:exodeoxyribonuclease VII small subunit